MTKTCRYGHGELAQAPGIWALIGFDAPTLAENGTDMLPMRPNGRAFTANAYRCPVCGYLEIFDDEGHDER